MLCSPATVTKDWAWLEQLPWPGVYRGRDLWRRGRAQLTNAQVSEQGRESVTWMHLGIRKVAAAGVTAVLRKIPQATHSQQERGTGTRIGTQEHEQGGKKRSQHYCVYTVMHLCYKPRLQTLKRENHSKTRKNLINSLFLTDSYSLRFSFFYFFIILLCLLIFLLFPVYYYCYCYQTLLMDMILYLFSLLLTFLFFFFRSY